MRWELSRRDVLKASLAGALLPIARAADALAPPKSGFRFTYFSDTHISLNRNIDECRAMLTEIAAAKPVLALNGGDVTDYGWIGEYENYRKLVADFGFPVYDVPGNHDVRWSPLGMQVFRKHLGEPHRRVDRDGVAFLLLDSTVPLSHWGHYEARQLSWLRRQLEQVGRTNPAVLVTHHWVGRERVMIDNESALLPLLDEFNVPLVLTGHGHADLIWPWGGAMCFQNRGLYQGSYMILDIDRDADVIRVQKRTAEKAELAVVAEVPLKKVRAARPSWPAPATEVERGAPLALLAASAQYRWNDGAWAPVSGGAAATGNLKTGLHELAVRTKEGGPTSVYNVEVTDDRAPLQMGWMTALNAGVMSHLRLEGDALFISCMDGSIHALDRKNGRERWRGVTGDYCHSSPLVTDESVIVGSADGHVYAFARKDGKLRWKTRTGGPVYASGALAKGIVGIASGDGVIYGLDPASGAVRWKYEMPKSNTNFCQSVAATDGERFFFGAWDSHLYALDAATGAFLWRQPCQERTFAFSPAIGGPAVAGGTVIVPANGNGLFCFDAKTGAKNWEVASPGDKFGHSSPMVVKDRIYVGCLGDKGEVRCLDMSGKEVWTAATGSVIYDSSPAVADGVVSIGSVDGTLSLIEAETGRIIHQHRVITGHFLSTPAAGDGWIYAATYGDRAFGFRLTLR